MSGQRDPVEAALGATEDLYDVATWDPRSALDRLAIRVYGGLRRARRIVLVVVAVVLFLLQLAAGGYVLLTRPTLGILALLSAVPGLLLVALIWWGDIADREPVELLAVTFLLAVLFAMFAAFVDSALMLAFRVIPVVGMVLFFYLAVGPIEETVKWLAVRVYAYHSDEFRAVVDGAVFGAVAGLGFSTIENSIYITHAVLAASSGAASAGQVSVALQTATTRAFVGPGHVIYSSFAGYYLGLAKFNPENRGPIVVKGLLIAAGIHATYDTLVSVLPLSGLAFVAFVVVYDGFFGYLLYRKLAAYRRKYREASTLEAGPDLVGVAETAPDE